MVRFAIPKFLLAKTFLGIGWIQGGYAGYCNWGPLGTGASSTCDGYVQGGDWCNVDQHNCEVGCGGRWCTNDGTTSSTSSTSTSSLPPGTRTATTTRYWDCSGGACACSYIPTGFTESSPAHCHSNAMFAAPQPNPYNAKYYGAAAISATLGGGYWMAAGCGKCWKVTGTSNVAGYAGVMTTLVLKGTNFCPDDNPMCAAGAHFDIAAPGFDVLQYSFAHVCPEREPAEAAGFAACGNWLINDPNPNSNCDCSLFHSPTLRAGCQNFYDLKWDNPKVVYEEVTCPKELSDLQCGYPYATEANMPETCANNVFAVTTTSSSSSSSTTSASTTSLTTPSTTSSTTTSSSTTTTTSSLRTTQPPPTTTSTTSTTTSITTQPPPTTTTTISSTTTKATTTSSNASNYCCTWNYGTCGDSAWCNASQSNCNVCGGKAWMQPNSSCIPLWGDCTYNRKGCCNPKGTVSCVGNVYYKQCIE